MQTLKETGQLDNKGNLKVQDGDILGQVATLLKEATMKRRIPSIAIADIPKATLISVAMLINRVDELEKKVKALQEGK
jgi:hypothetical protein